MSKRYIPNTNQEGYQTYENNKTGIKPEVITKLTNKMRILTQKMKTIRMVTENNQSPKKTQTPKIHQTKRHKQTKKRTKMLFWSGLDC